MPTLRVVEAVMKMPVPLVVVTGGEPALQRREVARLARELHGLGRRVEIETNGTVPLGELLRLSNRVVVSPKLSNSGMAHDRRLRPDVLRSLAGAPNTAFKFVVVSPAELPEVDEIVSSFGVSSDKVWIMPEGVDADIVRERMVHLAEAVASRGWSLSGRLHISLWGGTRGR